MELIIKELPEIRLFTVYSVYVGKPHSCMCGCSGTYTYTKINQEEASKLRGYEVKDDEVNDKEVLRVVNKVRANADKGVSVICVDDGFCFTAIIGKTQYTIYCK